MSGVLVDTSVWVSMVRGEAGPAVRQLGRLMADDGVLAHGLIRAEFLSGARDFHEYARFDELFAGVPLLADPPDLWDRLAKARFRLARLGIQAAGADLVLALAAEHHRVPLLSLDKDFLRFRRALRFDLHSPASR